MKKKIYPSNLTDSQWHHIKELFEAVRRRQVWVDGGLSRSIVGLGFALFQVCFERRFAKRQAQGIYSFAEMLDCPAHV